MTWIAVLVLSQFAAAQGHVTSNGGNTVVCGTERPLLIDVFEAKFHGWTFHALESFRGQPLATAFPKAAALFLKNDPGARDHVLRRFARRSREIRFETAPLPVQQRFSWVVAWRGCSIEQAAVLYGAVGRTREDLDLIVSARVWRTLPTDQRIALLIHEYLQGRTLQTDGPCAAGEIQNAIGFILSDGALRQGRSSWGVGARPVQGCDVINDHF